MMVVAFIKDYELNKVGEVKDLPNFVATKLIAENVVVPVSTGNNANGNKTSRMNEITGLRSKGQYVKKTLGVSAL